MPQLSSLTEDSGIAPVVRLDTIMVQDDSGQVSPLDVDNLSEFGGSAPLVVLDNSAVNIENSTDVVIGPVTNFNVNGNVTIFQEGLHRKLMNEEIQTDHDTNSKTPPPKPTSSWKIKFYSLPKTTRVFCVTLFAGLVATTIACAVIFTKRADSSSTLDPDYFADHLGTHPVYYRGSWGGKLPHDKIYLKRPPEVVVISHTATSPCHRIDECSKILQELQSEHMAQKWSDIGYNFMIGGDGAIYVGRGWKSINFHMMAKYSIGICFIGNFNQDVLSEVMIEAAELLMDKGLDMGALSVNYQVVGQNQTTKYQPMSPGSNVIEIMKKWSRYSSVIFFKH